MTYYATKSRVMLPPPKLGEPEPGATQRGALWQETRKLIEQGYPRKIARKMARQRCGYAS